MQLLLCLFGAFLGGCESPPLRVTLVGCHILRAESKCEITRDQSQKSNQDPSEPLNELRILVESNSETEITVFQGWSPLPSDIVSKDIGRLVSVRPRSGVSSLTVVVRKGLTWTSQELSIREWTASAWLQKAYNDWAYRGNTEEARLALEMHLKGEPLRLDDEAWAKGILGRIAIDANQIRKGKALLREAIQLDQQTSLIADEIRDSLWLREILTNHEHRFEDAARLLKTLATQASRQDASSLAWVELNYGINQLAQGKTTAVVEHTRRGEAWAERFGDREAVGSLRALRAEALQSMGRTKEANQLFNGLVEQEPAPCRKADLLQAQARVQSLALEAATSADPLLTPEVPLRGALALYGTKGATGCDQRLPMLNVLLNMAHLALLRMQWSEAQRLVDKVGAEIRKEPNAELELQLLQLRGQLALRRGSSLPPNETDTQGALNQALQEFSKLEAQSTAHQPESPQSSSLKEDGSSQPTFNEMRWQALIGTAEVRRAQAQHAAALEACLAADSYLEEYSRVLPLGAGRGGFLRRHERGTRLCLALFHEQGRVDEAFEWLRHVRVRALLPVLRLLRSTNLRKVEKYRSLRRDLDINIEAEAMAAMDQKEMLQQARARIYEQLLLIVESLAEDTSSTESLKMRPIQEGEVALICHPALQNGWFCIAANKTKKHPYFVPRLSKDIDPEKLSEWILRPISIMLDNARILRIFPYGDEMRTQIDIHLLPYKFNNKSTPLWEKLDVVYATDLPQLPGRDDLSVDNESSKALLIADPQEQFFGLRNVAKELEKTFRHSGWSTAVQIGGEKNYGDWPGKSAATTSIAVREQLRSRLAATDLFFYMGHAEVDIAAGWSHALKTADEAGLLVSDILLLHRAPRWAVLLGCQTSESAEEMGGEGLGIAQSFAVRGSEAVISTSRPVKPACAESVIRALAKNGLASKPPNLVDALRRSIAQLRHDPCLPEDELGAYRVIVPR